MQYRIRLINLETKEIAEITVSARMSLEELSSHIKVALRLPYTDHGWHHFQDRGITYMPYQNIIADEEMRGENGLPSLRYRDSNRVKIEQLFTTLDSSFVYVQEGQGDFGKERVRCTLKERIQEEQ